VTSSGSSDADRAGGLTRRALKAFDILAADEAAVAVAVSGGSDSIALLALAVDWGRKRGRRIEAATVDHGLRPEAAEEAAGVARLCERLGVGHSILHWRRKKTGTVAQAEARRGRHALLAEWANERQIGAVALGHTRDDRIETFLMRARAGSGWHGLAGPLPSGPSPVWPEGRGLRLIRPLLALGREELREELRSRKLDWIEDPSNEAGRFERVRMRALARRMDASAIARALRVMDALAAMRAAVAAEARQTLAKMELPADEARIPVETLRQVGSEARVRLVEALVMAAGGAEKRPRREPLERLTAWLAGPGERLSGGATLAGAWIRAGNGFVSISRAPARRGEAAGNDPCWDRAAALLADPMAGALAV
jgi:tRNA(Ile)-lysidine synthase